MNAKNPIITISNLNKIFELNSNSSKENSFTALNNISFTVFKEDFIIIAGSNGAGKSLLMRIIAGLDTQTNGDVQTKEKIGIIFQNADSQILGETPREDISFGLRNLSFSKEQINNKVEQVLKQTGLLSKIDYPARFMSGGEKRRLSIASILAMNSQIIIFDEPYSNLDFDGIIQVNQMITELKSNGKTIIILTHEIEKCLAFSNRFLVLHKGSLVFDGLSCEALKLNLEKWGIRNPLKSYLKFEDLKWL